MGPEQLLLLLLTYVCTKHSQDYLGEGQHDAIDQYDPSTPLAGGMVASMPYGQSYIESHYQAQHVNDLTDQMSHNYDPTSRMRSSTFPSYAPSAYASPGQYATTSAASSSWGYASATSSSDAWHSRALQMPSYGSYPSESLAGYPTTSGYASDEYSYMPALTPRPQSTSGSERRIHRYSPVPHRAIPDISQRRSYPSLHESKLADVPHPPRSPDEFIYTTSPASDADSPVNKYSKSVVRCSCYKASGFILIWLTQTEQSAAPSLSSGLPSTQPLYTHRDQVQFFEDALLNCPMSSEAGPFIPQLMYKPHTTSDRRRYVEEVDLDAPIYFWVTNPTECGISLSDALHSRLKRLQNKDQRVFEGRGPSVSIRIEVRSSGVSSSSILNFVAVARISSVVKADTNKRF